MNILDYLATEFASFDEKPFNPVDSAALSQFCMVRMEDIAPMKRAWSEPPSLRAAVADRLRPVRPVRFTDALRAEHYVLVPLVIALLLNEVINEKFKRVAQTVFFLPYFLSWAVMGGILRSLFQYDGMVNSVLTSLGMERIMFLGSNTWFPIIVILSDVWKDMGYNMIIFLAAITNVDPALNESAALDGANRWQQIWNITLPTIRPIVVMLLVLSLGSVLSAGLDQVMLLYNPMVYESGDIIDTLVYRLGLVNHQWSLSAAVGLMKSVISFILVVLSYRVATKRFDYQVF